MCVAGFFSAVLYCFVLCTLNAVSIDIEDLCDGQGMDDLAFNVDVDLADSALLPLPVTWAHTATLRQLPSHHRDPFDRMLVAQAMSEPMHLLTHDVALAAYTPLVTVV